MFHIDKSLIAVLPYDTSLYWVFKDCQPVELTNDDFIEIEKILIKCIEEYNPNREKQFNEFNAKFPDAKNDKKSFIIDLTRYKRQYIAVTNKNGEKEVWVNCFCDFRDKNWKENIVIVMDGGNCYFNLKMNLTTGKFYELMVNGEA